MGRAPGRRLSRRLFTGLKGEAYEKETPDHTIVQRMGSGLLFFMIMESFSVSRLFVGLSCLKGPALAGSLGVIPYASPLAPYDSR